MRAEKCEGRTASVLLRGAMAARLLYDMPLIGQATRYLITFGLVFLFWAWPVGELSMWLGLDGRVALGIVSLSGWIPKFFLHKYWVFQNSSQQYLRQPFWYTVIEILSIGLFNTCQFILQTYFEVPVWWTYWITTLGTGGFRFVAIRVLFRR